MRKGRHWGLGREFGLPCPRCFDSRASLTRHLVNTHARSAPAASPQLPYIASPPTCAVRRSRRRKKEAKQGSSGCNTSGVIVAN
jgi:hypothetical protein